MMKKHKRKNKKIIATSALSRFYRITSIISYISSALFLFLVPPYEVWCFFCLVLPVVFFTAYAVKSDKWHALGTKDCNMAAFGAFSPICAMVMRFFIDFSIVNWAAVAIPTVVIIGSGTISLLVVSSFLNNKLMTGSIVSICVTIALYAPFASLYINGFSIVDSAVYEASVQKLRNVTTGVRPSTTILTATVDTEIGTRTVDVPSNVYDLLSTGGRAYYILDSGWLGIINEKIYPIDWVD